MLLLVHGRLILLDCVLQLLLVTLLDTLLLLPPVCRVLHPLLVLQPVLFQLENKVNNYFSSS
jgi:hypothetical protein